jgi:TetR/AcrR family tetracycline transcriptional repressor
MARPKVPLISRRTALEAALKIIDEEGLATLSIRRLADALGVNGASLYHHFANKEDIVVGAAELALSRVRTPETTDESWRIWLLRNSLLLRDAMLEHPALIPIIVGKVELGMGVRMMDSSAARLVAEGVPIGTVTPLLEALELLAIGSAVQRTRRPGPEDALIPQATLARANAERALSSDEIFELVARAIVARIEAASAPVRVSADR